jgi:hypothetical protein
MVRFDFHGISFFTLLLLDFHHDWKRSEKIYLITHYEEAGSASFAFNYSFVFFHGDEATSCSLAWRSASTVLTNLHT